MPDLQAVPLSALAKAQVAVRRTNRASSTAMELGSVAGSSRLPVDRILKVKAQLVDLQRRKGRAAALVAEGDGVNDERPDKLESRARIHRDSKHAYVR